MEHLDKTMTEYVLELEKATIEHNPSNKWKDALKYANFLSESLNPSMFVSAVFEDGKWVILKEPKGWKAYIQENGWKSLHPDALKRCCTYAECINNVYFEGFEVNTHKECVYLKEDEAFCFDIDDLQTKTIEELIPYKLKLTPTIQNRLK